MAAPPNYNPTPLTPSAGGTIHAMSGGGDGGAPPGYNSTPLTPYAEANIKAYTGGGPDNTPITGTTSPNVAATNAVKNGPAVSATAQPKKQISLGGLTLSIGPPWELKEGSNEMEALAWFGVDKAPDMMLKKEVLQALYDGVCDTDKPLIMVLECEPIRRLVQSLAEKLLGNLTRPVSKKTSAEIAAVAEQQKKTAKLMSFNVFKNQCKKETAKDYIEKSDADIVCTQQDTKTEFTNYTEIKACGDANSATRVYLRKNTPFKLNIECIEGDHSAVIFTYQGVTIINMGSSNGDLLKKVLEKKPNIILGSVNDIVLPSNEWTRADTINKEMNTTDAIWYKKDDTLFELKNTIVGNIKVKNDDYTKPDSCSFSDHNPITTEINFKRTLNQLATNADQAAKVAAVGATETVQPGSLLVDALGMTSSVPISMTKPLTAEELAQKKEADALVASQQASTAVEGIDDELAKKIAVSAVAAMLQDGNQESVSHKRVAEVEDPDATSSQETTQVSSPASLTVPVASPASLTAPGSSPASPSQPPSQSSSANAASVGLALSPVSPQSSPLSQSFAESPLAESPLAESPLAESPLAESPLPASATAVTLATSPVEIASMATTEQQPISETVSETASLLPATSTQPNSTVPLPVEKVAESQQSTQLNSTVPVEKIASAAAATVAASSSAPIPVADEGVSLNAAIPVEVDTASSSAPISAADKGASLNAAIPVEVEEISDELAKKIAVAAVAVLLQNGNQRSTVKINEVKESTPQLSIAKPITKISPMNEMTSSINGLNNISSKVNNKHNNVLHYNEAPHGNELESPIANQSEIPSSTPLSNSPVVLHREINESNSPNASNPKNMSSSHVDVHTSYNNELDSVLELANNADKASSQSTYQPSKSIPRSTLSEYPSTMIPSIEPLPKPPANSNNLLTNTKEKTTAAVKESSGNQQINLTENVRKRNALIAELKKQKKIMGLNQQIRNEGTNFSKSRVEEPVAEPIVKPVAKPTMKPMSTPMTNSLNALMASPKKISSEKVALTPNQQPLRKLIRIHGRIEQTIYNIEEYFRNMNRSNDPLQTAKRNILNNYISSLNAFLPEIIGYKGMKSKYQNNKRVTDIITKADNIIGDVNKIIYSSGGKRRTHKKRKQKKQKKHFGTQKK